MQSFEWAVSNRILLMVVRATQNPVSTPGPATALVRFLQVPLVKLTGVFGHLATSYEETTLCRVVASFLKP